MQAKVMIHAVQQAVAKQFGITVAELRAKNQARDAVTARHLAIYLIRRHTAASLQEIGRHFGGCHHTTVLYAIARITERSRSDRKLRGVLAALQDALGIEE